MKSSSLFAGLLFFYFFFFNDTATTEIYTLSLHDALPICGPAAVVAGRAGTLARDGPRAAGRASRRQPGRPLCAGCAARERRRAHGGRGPAHASHSLVAGRAVPAGRGWRRAPVRHQALAALAAARRAERPGDLDANGLVRAGRAPHRGPRRICAPRPSHRGFTRSVGAPGAGRAGGGGGRWAARGLLAPEPGAPRVVASTAAARLRRAPHQLPGA